MSTNAVRGIETSVAPVDMKFEIVVIPVSDVDRAKQFYAKLGWRLDADYDNGKDFRVIQFTPPGSGCSVHLRQECHPGGARLRTGSVPDRFRHRGRPQSVARSRRADQRSVPQRRRVRGHGRGFPVWTSPRQWSGSRTSQLPLVRFIQRSGRQRVAIPGNHGAAAGSYRSRGDEFRFGERSGERDAARFGGAWGAREAHRRGGSELARLVREVHGGGAGRDGTSEVSWRSELLKRAGEVSGA